MASAKEPRVHRGAILLLLSLILPVCFEACGEGADELRSPNRAQAGASGSSSAGVAGVPNGSSGGSDSIGGNGGGSATTSVGGASGSGGPMDAGGAAGIAGAMGADGSGGAMQDVGVDVEPPRDAGSDRTIPADAGIYNPCPPKGRPCVILPVGDSITAGSHSSTGGGYRLPLFRLANKNTKSITFVGASTSGPSTVDGLPFPRANSGYSGYNIDTVAGRQGIAQFFPAQITAYRPNIILLMIGTNDVDSGETSIPPRLAKLMDVMLNADPSLLLVVAQIVPQQKAVPDTKNMQVEAYNAAIPGLVKARADAGKHVKMVDMYGALTANPNYSTAYLDDKLHPNDAGYAVMADTWYAAIGSLLR
jgi:lysophospholipase L1-like esterase